MFPKWTSRASFTLNVWEVSANTTTMKAPGRWSTETGEKAQIKGGSHKAVALGWYTPGKKQTSSLISSQVIPGMIQIEEKKMQEKLLQQSHTVGLSEADDCLL